ncbi:pentapeptide repeat-containing protein [Pseudodesulfovibrio sediminis]|uniref:Potassium channel domain-containing protein n=1 Tax=Pseudodesulfovibrio sediminis TaxID=2810563 RepID=A0ABN6EX27_9BACT|nr:pentapeptide repeat-containing protein [Pseudodesulfovibrio sediminis]BCS89987.1 hypothetical protein PSDVSF_32290 [Pseudodesulfovibrio sediminis]
MANPDHLKILEQGVETWNKWREDNPEVVPDFQNAELNGLICNAPELVGLQSDNQIFQWKTIQWLHGGEAVVVAFDPIEKMTIHGINFQGVDFRGAQLKGAKFLGADFKEADLRGANLHMALLWGTIFHKAKLNNVVFDFVEAYGSSFYKAKFTDAFLQSVKFQRTNCVEVSFKRTKCLGADFSDSAIELANFQSAKLTKAIFHGSSIIEAKFQGAELSWANLSDTQVAGVEFDNKMNCRGISVTNCEGSQRFIRHVMDLDYIEETKEKHPKFYWWWKNTSDCGRSWGHWAVISFGIAMIFGGIMDLSRHLLTWFPWMDAFVPAMQASHLQDGWLTPYYFSIVTFTTLGFGDVVPVNTAGQVLLILEVVTGYFMLGGLITLFATRIVRQSG